MNYAFVTAVQNDLSAVDDLVRANLNSQVPLVEEIASYLVEAGGKRLRPMLVLLSARACGYQGSDHITLATIIEFLHTAMLLHDDVVDESDLRRGRKTVNSAWGNAASVLVGDFLHSRAFEMMVEIGDIRIMEILARATNIISEGEVQQLSAIGNPSITEAEYREIITRKTAMLFQAASHSGAVLAGAERAIESELRDFGLNLGIAFQLIDDQLDYRGETESLGKNTGDDLAESKVTLPLIIAMQEGSEKQRAYIARAIKEGGVENLPTVLDIVEQTGALDYTLEAAKLAGCQARGNLQSVPESKYAEAMSALIAFVVDRHY